MAKGILKCGWCDKKANSADAQRWLKVTHPDGTLLSEHNPKDLFCSIDCLLPFLRWSLQNDNSMPFTYHWSDDIIIK